MEMHARVGVEVNIACSQVCRLLHAGTSVVQEEQQSSIAQGMAPIDRHPGQRAFDLIAFKKNSFRRLSTLPRNSGDFLSLTEPLRKSLPNIFEEGAEGRQSLVARLGRVFGSPPTMSKTGIRHRLEDHQAPSG